MRYHRGAVCAATAVTAAAAASAAAFTTTPTAVSTGSSCRLRSYFTGKCCAAAAASRFSGSIVPAVSSIRGCGGGGGRMVASSSSSSLSLNLLERFFGGGANALRIDYSKLDHPGPELGAWAAADKNHIGAVSARDPNLHLATFAGGCFWGMELAFQRVPGVVYTCAGYTQGSEPGACVCS